MGAEPNDVPCAVFPSPALVGCFEVGARKLRLAIVGAGNCASALMQGLRYYAGSQDNEALPGLMSTDIGGYRVSDIEIAAIFDVHAQKVGKDVAEAIHVKPNNTIRFADIRPTGLTVQRGPTLDGLGSYAREEIEELGEQPVNVAEVLDRSRTDVVVSYLPVGSQKASEYYVEQAIAARCGYVNCIPVFLASDSKWRKRFEESRVPIIGDDIKSQVGATIVHRALVNLFRERGVQLDRTYQLNFGGNSDFRNMLERDRLTSKKISKTRSVNSQLEVPLTAENIHIGPSDFIPWLGDRKFAHIRMEGTAFGGVPLNIELKLEVWDSPNSAGVVIDAIRCAKLALDRGVGGALVGPSSYYMKSPPQQFTDHEARERTLSFIKDES